MDGYIWEKAPKQIQVKLRNPYYVGLAVTSRNAGVVSTAVFDNLKIDTTDNTFAQQSWKGADIGKVGTAGDFQIDKEIITIRGSGDNIFQAPYGFQYVYKSISGDFSMIVKLNSFEAAQSWAKTGIVIRQSLEPKSDFIDLVATPAEYAQMEWKNGNEAKAINMNLWETKNKIFRKCIHFISYFTLTLLVYAIFSFFNVCGRKKYIFSIITIIIIASLDEFHQSFVPSRGASALDVLIDTAGSNLALFILWTGSKYKEKFMLRR
ncbi:MAG: VanZ family protein [Clostridia bacterium]|nr:VanZ family protein [Clostridia bacterium]